MLLRNISSLSKYLIPIHRRPGLASMAYNSSNPIHIKIDKLIKDSDKKLFVFMKGDPKQPQCGFSRVVVQILDAYGLDYDSFNVLEDPKIRDEIKTYSDWPTIPQVFKDGSFVGGCDILMQMHENGELETLAQAKKN